MTFNIRRIKYEFLKECEVKYDGEGNVLDYGYTNHDGISKMYKTREDAEKDIELMKKYGCKGTDVLEIVEKGEWSGSSLQIWGNKFLNEIEKNGEKFLRRKRMAWVFTEGDRWETPD